MKVIRSWPEQVPEGRCYVVDTLPRLVMRDYDYRCLGDVDDDVVLLEWDVAVSREDLQVFIDRAKANPNRVIVAPYRLYTTTRESRDLPKTVWAHRRYVSETRSAAHFVDEGEPTCHLFGLGMAYLPKRIVRDFLDDWPGHFNDASFSGWHYLNVSQETPITWDVRPVHLHYLIDRMA